jgi:hypothetical protein
VTCVLCGQKTPDEKILTNGEWYHEACLESLEKLIAVKRVEKYNADIKVQKPEGFLSKIRNLFLKDGEINVLRSFAKDNRENNFSKTIDKLLYERSKIYDYWPTYPPDWDERRQKIRFALGGHCQECGKQDGVIHLHHKLPISKGGSHKQSNLILLCEGCHSLEHGGKGMEFSEHRRKNNGTAFENKMKKIEEAISKKLYMKIKYETIDYKNTNANREELQFVITERVIKPYKIGAQQEFSDLGGKFKDALCVRGFCFLRKEERTFRVDRIRRISVVRDPYK